MSTSTSLGQLVLRFTQQITFVAVIVGILPAVSPARAQTNPAVSPSVLGTGVISGRVYNAATNAYVRNAEVRVEGTDRMAYTEDGGYYRLSGVPTGSVSIVVVYTGSETAKIQLQVGPGSTATQDFELRPSIYAGKAAADNNIVELSKFVVSTEREGQAKAIMDQRAALNGKNVVAADNYGVLTMGDVGEFLKYMPGMSVDFLEVDTSAVRIGGLDPKYSTFTQDGTRMAASDPGFGSDSRRNTFEQMSITGIESIELNNTLTASMEADAPAGNINLRSKNAFERKGRQIVFQAAMDGTTDALRMGKSYLPDEKLHYKIYPAGQLGYGDVFLNGRLGIEANISYNPTFVQQDRNQLEYNYTNPARPVITGIMWRPGPKVTERLAGNISLDYKVSPNLVFSWRSSYSRYFVEFYNQYTWLRANIAQITPDSTLTHVIAGATANANTRLGTEYSHRANYQPNITLGPKLEYKKDSLTLTLRGGYSHSETANRDMEDGFFRNTNNRVTRISWEAERSSADSPNWTVRQLSGANWSVPGNWGASDAFANNILSNADKTKAQQFSLYFDGKKALHAFGLPLEIKSGLAARLNTYASKSGNQSWTYVGPTGNQLQAVIPATVQYRWDPQLDGDGGNVPSLGWRADDTYGTYRIFQQHPEYFVPDALANFTNNLIGPRSIKEEIDSAYLEGSTRWQKLRLNLGLRGERTRTTSKIWDPRPRADIVAAGFPVNAAGAPTTTGGVLYQYHNGQRSLRYGNYSNLFLSGGGKYSFSRNLTGQLAMSDSILRPDYQNLAGITTVNDTTATVTVPNPSLKPETSTKYYASLQYNFEPAGVLSLSAYRFNVKNQLTGRSQITAQGAGFGDQDYPGYTFFGFVNGNARRRTDGVTLDYNQQLTFLPGVLRGLSVFGSVTRVIADQQQLRLSPKTANGGIKFRYRAFNMQIRSTWQASRLISITTPLNDHLWLKERTLIDVSGGYRLSQHFELMLSVRNIFNAPSIQYSNEPGRIQLYDVYGSLWNFGVKGMF